MSLFLPVSHFSSLFQRTERWKFGCFYLNLSYMDRHKETKWQNVITLQEENAKMGFNHKSWTLTVFIQMVVITVSIT